MFYTLACKSTEIIHIASSSLHEMFLATLPSSEWLHHPHEAKVAKNLKIMRWMDFVILITSLVHVSRCLDCN